MNPCPAAGLSLARRNTCLAHSKWVAFPPSTESLHRPMLPTCTFDHSDATTVSLTGGKGANLAELTRAGFEVPPGFVVTTALYHTFLDESGVRAELASFSTANDADLASRCARLRTTLEAAPLPAGAPRGDRQSVRRSGWRALRGGALIGHAGGLIRRLVRRYARHLPGRARRERRHRRGQALLGVVVGRARGDLPPHAQHRARRGIDGCGRPDDDCLRELWCDVHRQPADGGQRRDRDQRELGSR
jgi:hypothetical protein